MRNRLLSGLLRLARSDEGATLVEYAFVVLLIATLSITLVTTIGQIALSFFSVNSAL